MAARVVPRDQTAMSRFGAVSAGLALMLGFVAAARDSRADDPPPRPADPEQARERTCFQTHARWAPDLQLRSDVAICYGIDRTLPERIAQWKAQGYIPHLMTGVAWGSYQDYLYGRFDGQRHVDEVQTERSGRVISHGGDVYYMSPGESFGAYLCQGVKRAIDAGAEAIHLEEPEFWARGGYGEGFKREWKSYYREDWVAPHSSPDAQYRAARLMYHLYGRALKQVFDFVRADNERTGKHIRCYVPTHSLINYAHWNIVSPESSLLKVGADGYIAQVWTGTARTPNVYEGTTRERTFETAFLEYGAMMNVVQASGGTVWFLNDPIEDDPNHSWEDYRTNWESTLTASLLWPQVWRYEVMPWPDRIFRGRRPAVDRAKRALLERPARIPIPEAYATEILTVIDALNHMEQNDVTWDCGTRGIGVVVSDTLMFQRGEPNPSDRHLGSFFGLALPLVKRGIPVEPAQLENATLSGALAPYKVLLMTYEGMKPMTAEVHTALAGWVRNGGALVFLGDDSDPYNAVRAWWNDGTPAAGAPFRSPRQHLFEQLGVSRDAAAGLYKVGRGTLIYDLSSPAALTYQLDGAGHVRSLARQGCEAVGLAYRETNYFSLRRGPYAVAVGLDESLPDAPRVLRGRFLDLFDARLPVLDAVTLTSGSRRLLLDLDRVETKAPVVLASSCKILGAGPIPAPQRGFRFHAEGPDKTLAVVRLRLDAEPKEATVDGKPIADDSRAWHAASNTLWLRFPNAASGHEIVVREESSR
jgi:hypothetical protein